MKRVEFPLDQNVYNRRVVFLHGTRSDLNRWAKRTLKDDELIRSTASGNYSVFTRTNGSETDYISVIAGFSRSTQLESLAHEVCHHAVYVFSRIKAPIVDGHEEPFCYYVQQVIRQCLRVMKV